jgi:hypothetical protein
MKRIADTAFVVSVHYEGSRGYLHISLRWQGNHDISAFDLDRLGKVVQYEAETEDSGWAIIEPYNRLNTYPEELLPPFGSAALEPSFLISGDTVPLREKGPVEPKSPNDPACFLHSMTVCAKERRLVTMARCFLEELAKCCRRSGIRRQRSKSLA